MTPIPVTAPPPAYEVPPRAAMVRPYVLDPAHRAQRTEERRKRVDQQRLAVGVLMDLGRPESMWHCPAEGCEMSAPYPVAHSCPLIDPARRQRPMAEVAR